MFSICVIWVLEGKKKVYIEKKFGEIMVEYFNFNER